MSSPKLTIKMGHGEYEVRLAKPGELGPGIPTLFEIHIERALKEALEWQGMQAMELLTRVGLRSGYFRRDRRLIALELMKEMQRGFLILSRADEDEREASPGDKAWNAYQSFKAQFGKEFVIGTRKHRLVTRESADQVRRHDDYDVVASAEAASTLLAYAKRAGVLQAETETVCKSLVDMRAPASHEGFVLLRAPLSQAARVVSHEVFTPSQLKEIVDRKEKGWIAVRLLDVDGHPVNNCPIKIEDAEGGTFDANCDKNGAARIELVSRKGPAIIHFPRLPDGKGKMGKGTNAKAELSTRKTSESQLVVVPGGPPVEGKVDEENVCCLVQPVMTVAFIIPEQVEAMEVSEYILRSADGAYEQKRLPKDDLIPGDNLLQLEFEELLVDGLYTLTKTGDHGQAITYFSDRTFMEIVDQPRGEEFERHFEAQAHAELPPLEGEFDWPEALASTGEA